MTRAMGLGNLPNLVEGASNWRMVERLFERHGLPLAVIDHPTQRIPLASMIGLFEDAGEVVGDRALGLRVGMHLKHAGYGAWAQYVASAPILSAALQRAVRTVQFQQTGVRFSLDIQGDYTVWRYHRPRGSNETCRHYSDHLLPPMISLVRCYLGEAWAPSWIDLDYSRTRNSIDLAQMLKSEIRFSQPAVAIAIRSCHLSAHLQHKRSIETTMSLNELRSHFRCNMESGRSAPIRDIIALRLLEGKVDLEGAAQLSGIGPRTIQRMLKDDGTKYRQLVNDARHQRALFLLSNSELSIGQVAAALGYEDFANFTRAFRQWTGRPPSRARSTAAEMRGNG